MSLLDDNYKPPFIPKPSYKAEDNFAELQKLDVKELTLDFADSKFADRVEIEEEFFKL